MEHTAIFSEDRVLSRLFPLFFLSVCILLLAVQLTACGTENSINSPIRLNEACCSNFTLFQDPETRDYPDYLELINTGEEEASTEGYYVSDRLDDLEMFQIPPVTLQAGETLLLLADGKGESGSFQEGPVHLNFSLKPGETLLLSLSDGTIIDTVTMAERKKNISMSVLNGVWKQAEGTPGTANEGAREYVPATLDKPVLSLPTGFYSEPQVLEMETMPGCEIRYTLDGSLPTEESLLYDGALTLVDVSDQPNRILSQPNTTLDRSGAVTDPVPKGTVIRAAAFDGSGAHSDAITTVYFIGDFSVYRSKAIINLTVDPDDLFGDEGIAVTGQAYDAWVESGQEGERLWPNYMNRGRFWERDAQLALWDKTGNLQLDSACGIRLQGDSSRASAIKRFSLFARSVYGTDNVFPVPVFGDSLSHSLYLRPSLNEMMVHQMTAEFGLGGQDAIPVNVFLNGEYYCSCYIRERYDKQYFETHFGVDGDDVVTISNNRLDKGTNDDYADYCALMEMLQNGDCADSSFYAAVCEKIDVENYATFMATNLFLNNTDWSVYKNYRLWRTRSSSGEGYSDGRWRWLIYDMDACYWTRPAFGDAPRASYDLFTYPAPYTEEPFLEMPVFRELLRSPDFRCLFTRIWLDIMNVSLSYSRVLPILERYGKAEDPFWPDFLRDRPGYAVDMLIRNLELDAAPCELTLAVSDTEGGTVILDKLDPDLSAGTWTGTYLTDVTVTLCAVPADGWAFAGWQGDKESDQSEIRITLGEGNNEYRAVFERK